MSSSEPTTADLTRDTRVRSLIESMTIEEKVAQLVGLWLKVDRDSGAVAPLQDAMDTTDSEFTTYARNGLGQITRHYGTRPVDPRAARAALAGQQRWLLENTRWRIPALVHEECLTGLAAWQAATYPVPPAWGATFHPELIQEMATRIGRSMRRLGIHQGLAPVLDVIRDMRWGRVEECVSEDPYHVAVTAAAYVSGLQREGMIATLKHFVGYSNSRAGRNLAPVHAGEREVRDVLLFPFEVAVRDAGARSVMNSYAEIDGVPVAASEPLLTTVLRDEWGFTGTVVADYFAVAFLHTLHGVAADLGDAAAQAITAGIDVELPTGVAYLEPLLERIRSGAVPERVVDRALERVLTQKAELGLLDPEWRPEPDEPIELDTAEDRRLAREIAEQSVVLVHNRGVLPLSTAAAGTGAPRRIGVIGPNARSVSALFGCYSFVNHVLPHHPGTPVGLDVETVDDALRREFTRTEIAYAHGTGVDDGDLTGISAAAEVAAGSDVAIVVVGDRSGLFGRGTSGEGCDVESLELPGAQRRLVETVLATGTPTVVVLLSGRAYAIGWLLDQAAAVVQAFFPGECGADAVAGVLSGRVNPSGRTPMSFPRGAGSQPYSYLHPKLGAASSVTNVDTAPPVRFGHGLSYTTFAYGDLVLEADNVDVNGLIGCSVTLANTGHRDGAEVVQLYASDPVASVTRPLAQLVAFQRVHLAAGERTTIRFRVPTRLLAFTGRDGVRVIEPGEIRLSLRRDAEDVIVQGIVQLVGAPHRIDGSEPRLSTVTVTRPEVTHPDATTTHTPVA